MPGDPAVLLQDGALQKPALHLTHLTAQQVNLFFFNSGTLETMLMLLEKELLDKLPNIHTMG